MPMPPLQGGPHGGPPPSYPWGMQPHDPMYPHNPPPAPLLQPWMLVVGAVVMALLAFAAVVAVDVGWLRR